MKQPVTAEQWAEWVAGFCGFGVGHFEHEEPIPAWQLPDGAFIAKENFNPLRDANHLMLVLDEIERRGCFISLHADPDDDPDKKYAVTGNRSGKACGECGWAKTECFEEEAPTRNLAVLRAAHALEGP